MKKAMSLRDAIAAVKPRQFIKLEPIPTGGSLELRRSSAGALSFYFRFTLNYKTERVQIGLYDSSAPPKSLQPTKKGYSLVAARAAAGALSAKHHEARENGGLREVLKSEAAEARAKKEAAKATGQTLEMLFAEYVNYLKARNKETGKQARNLFEKNVKRAFPGIATTQANKVTTGQISDVLRLLSLAGKKTTARKLKAYLSAAFESAKNVENSPIISEGFKIFNVKKNPVADVGGIANSAGVDKNPLTPEEMRKYWVVVNKPGKEAALLQLHLLLGGQRLEQLLRLKNSDITAERLILEDTKGRAGNVRPIVVPLIPAARMALNELLSKGDYAISVTPGVSMSSTTARAWAKKVVGSSIENFELKRIRSGVATLLSKLKVSSEIRCHLQSHDLNGVENKHYNAFEYLDEKRQALTAMYNFLNAPKRAMKSKETTPRAVSTPKCNTLA